MAYRPLRPPRVTTAIANSRKGTTNVLELAIDSNTKELIVFDGVQTGGYRIPLNTVATSSKNGLMSSTDKASLDELAAQVKSLAESVKKLLVAMDTYNVLTTAESIPSS